MHCTCTGLDPVVMLSIIQDLEIRLKHVETMLGIRVPSQSLITYPTTVHDQSQVMDELFLHLLHHMFDLLINQLPSVRTQPTSLQTLPSQASVNGMPTLPSFSPVCDQTQVCFTCIIIAICKPGLAYHRHPVFQHYNKDPFKRFHHRHQ